MRNRLFLWMLVLFPLGLGGFTWYLEAPWGPAVRLWLSATVAIVGLWGGGIQIQVLAARLNGRTVERSGPSIARLWRARRAVDELRTGATPSVRSLATAEAFGEFIGVLGLILALVVVLVTLWTTGDV